MMRQTVTKRHNLSSLLLIKAVTILLCLGMVIMTEAEVSAEIVTERFGGSASRLDYSGLMKSLWFEYYGSTLNAATLYFSGGYSVIERKYPYDPYENGARRNLLYVDLTAISQGTKVIKAEYIMPVNRKVYPFSKNQYRYGLSIYKVTDPDGTGMWDEEQLNVRYKRSGVPWTSSGDGQFHNAVEPTKVATIYDIKNYPTNAFYRFDITSLVQQWVDDPASNLGMTFDDTVPGDAQTDPEFRPYIEVSYEGPNPNRPAQPANIDAFHRSGQTFITWTETPYSGPYWEMRYRIYRHTSPIDSLNLSDAQLAGELDQNSSYNERRSSERVLNEPHNYKINNDASELSDDTGLFVYTAKADGSYYYAVTSAQEGNENRDDFSSQNVLQSPVAESVSLPEPVVQEVYDDGRTLSYECVHWADETMSYNYGWGFNFMINVPYVNDPNSPTYDPDAQVAVDVNLDGRGTTYFNTGSYGGMLRIKPDDLLPPTKVTPYPVYDGLQTWWSGALNNYKTGEHPQEGRVIPYTENRILYYIDYVKAKYNIDENRIYMRGGSMGGTGAIHFGLKYPEIFAGLNAGVGSPNWRLNVQPVYSGGVTDYSQTQPGYKQNGESMWGLESENALHENGVPIWDWMDGSWYAMNYIAKDMPMISLWSNKNDGSVAWYGYPQFYQAMQDSHHGFYAYWGQSGHYADAFGRYWGTFLKNENFPALSNASCNEDIGPFDPETGMAVVKNGGSGFLGQDYGTINMYLEWSRQLSQFDSATTDDDILDEIGRYEVALRISQRTFMDLPPYSGDSATVDITPRRLQNFVVTAGNDYYWENKRLSTGEIIQSGRVTADSYSLITVPGFIVEKTTLGNKLIITPAAGTSLPGDVNGNGTVDILDLQACVNVFLGTETRPDFVQTAKEVVEPKDECNVLDVQAIVNVILG